MLSSMNPLLKLAIEIGPLATFFIAYSRAGLMTATGLFMAATLIALAVAYALERRIPIMPLVAGVVVFVFGGLTLLLDDETFIKLKPTIVNALFAAILFGGLVFRRSLLKPLFGPVFQLDEEGWRVLTVRWAFFFTAVAVLNEIVWRSTTTDVWVNFKVFGILPLTLAFSIAQLPLIRRRGKLVGEEAS